MNSYLVEQKRYTAFPTFLLTLLFITLIIFYLDRFLATFRVSSGAAGLIFFWQRCSCNRVLNLSFIIHLTRKKYCMFFLYIAVFSLNVLLLQMLKVLTEICQLTFSALESACRAMHDCCSRTQGCYFAITIAISQGLPNT